MNIAILGTGNMGKALIAGMRRKYGEEIHIVAYDRKEGALKVLIRPWLLSNLNTGLAQRASRMR